MTLNFLEALESARATKVPEMALRRHSDRDPVLAGKMDDVVVKDVEMFRAEQLGDGHLWLACYFHNGERVTFDVWAHRKNDLRYDVCEMPDGWVDIDAA